MLTFPRQHPTRPKSAAEALILQQIGACTLIPGRMHTKLPSAVHSITRSGQSYDFLTCNMAAIDQGLYRRSAVPAPLQVHPKRLQTSGACSLRSQLPGQPVFNPAEGFNPDILQPPKACNCPKSPPSSAPSPFSTPRYSSFSSNRGPSLDFSSLFMKSPTLRHELENCTCHRAETPLSGGLSVPSEADRSSRASIGSGYTSIYSSDRTSRISIGSGYTSIYSN